jgi:hypothetical protein
MITTAITRDGRIRWCIWSFIERGTAGVHAPLVGNQSKFNEKIKMQTMAMKKTGTETPLKAITVNM